MPHPSTRATSWGRLSYSVSMIGPDSLRELFVASAKLVAFARCLPDAERHRSGVILTLSSSQAARDGLAAAARSFAQFASQRGVRGEAARVLAISMAHMAPTNTWWRPLFESSRPILLGQDDTWKSLADLRAIASEVGSVNDDASEAHTA